MPESLAQDGPAELGFPVGGSGGSSGNINKYDGTIHNADGSRTFPDGSRVSGVNNWAQRSRRSKRYAQVGEIPSELPAGDVPVAAAPPAELPASAPGKINQWDGTIHGADGKRTFPGGGPVSGVNGWAQRLYQDDLSNEST